MRYCREARCDCFLDPRLLKSGGEHPPVDASELDVRRKGLRCEQDNLLFLGRLRRRRSR
jgi:hypothetical protein